MADLAVTSRMNVIFDLMMVALVIYCAPIQESWEVFDWRDSIVHYDTMFVGMGVLSFAFVCQHSVSSLDAIKRLSNDLYDLISTA